MKKYIISSIIALAAIFGCQPSEIAVEGLTIDKTELTVEIGQSATLTATVQPANATNKEITWSIDNASIASVNNGVVTAIAAGSAKVIAKCQSFYAVCHLTVPSNEIAVQGISLDKTSLALKVGESATLTATVEPANATNKEVTWSIDNAKVASINNGVVTALAAGSAKITAKAGQPACSTTCNLTVSAGDEPPVPVTGLSKEEAEQARLEVIASWKASETARLQDLVAKQKGIASGDDTNESSLKGRTREYFYVTDVDNHIMKYFMDTYGAEPEGGHSLWISLHGGGTDDTGKVNEGQWWNQQYMYRSANPAQPAEGIYVSPRAYKDTYDLWYFRGNDGLFRQIIQTMVVLYGVNPDKVYLMGYSAGGDGVWRMAPRLADHWAAASMMAGHPGSVRFENLRNLPFMMWVGGNDTDYSRNTEVPAASGRIDDLQKADPEGYVHELHVQAGRPHWMELDDAAAFPWMAAYTRNPYPKKIVWRQENEEKKMPEAFFYWLKVADKHITGRSDDDAPGSSTERKKYLGKELTASIDGNTITIEKCDYDSFSIYLNDQMVDLDQEVTVKYNGRNLFKGIVERTRKTLEQSMAERNDPSYVFPAEIVVSTK